MKLQSQNRALILKWSFDFEMERGFLLKGFSSDLLYKKEARDLSSGVLALVHSLLFTLAKAVH